MMFITIASTGRFSDMEGKLMLISFLRSSTVPYYT
jgi:hypothetical protein